MKIVLESNRSLADVVKLLAKNLVSEKIVMVVRRGYVVVDALKRVAKYSFHPTQTIQVKTSIL